MNKKTKEYELAMSYRDLFIRTNDDLLNMLKTAIDFDLPRSQVTKRTYRLLEESREMLKRLDEDAL